MTQKPLSLNWLYDEIAVMVVDVDVRTISSIGNTIAPLSFPTYMHKMLLLCCSLPQNKFTCNTHARVLQNYHFKSTTFAPFPHLPRNIISLLLMCKYSVMYISEILSFIKEVWNSDTTCGILWSSTNLYTPENSLIWLDHGRAIFEIVFFCKNGLKMPF